MAGPPWQPWESIDSVSFLAEDGNPKSLRLQYRSTGRSVAHGCLPAKRRSLSLFHVNLNEEQESEKC